MANGFGSLYVGASGLQNSQYALKIIWQTLIQKGMCASRFVLQTNHITN